VGLFTARGQTSVGKYRTESYWTIPADTQTYLFIYLPLEGNRRTSSQIQANVYDKLHLQHRRKRLQVRPKHQ